LINLLEPIKAAVCEAGRLAMRYYGTVPVEVKSDRSVITEADRQIDAFLARRGRDILPNALYIGGETAHDDNYVREAAQAEWVWVVDPIDGTGAFADGIETFCVCMGLIRNGLPYAGAVHFPALNHLYLACDGLGATCDGRPIRVLDAQPAAGRAMLNVDWDIHQNYRLDFPGHIRSLGSAAMHYLLVARGVGVGAISAIHIWDYMAAVAVLQEAGGIVRHLDGSEVDWRKHLAGHKILPPVLGAPPSLWPELARAIKYIGPSL
jgi:fructose-1,6-bisphosphatase/inositol monophosphatase family enzyme